MTGLAVVPNQSRPAERPPRALLETSAHDESWLVCATPAELVGEALVSVYRLGVVYRLRCPMCGHAWRDEAAVGHLDSYPPATWPALDLGDSAPLCPACVDDLGRAVSVPRWLLSSLVAVRLLLRVQALTCGRLSREARGRVLREDSDSTAAPRLHLDADLRGRVLAAWDAYHEARP